MSTPALEKLTRAFCDKNRRFYKKTFANSCSCKCNKVEFCCVVHITLERKLTHTTLEQKLTHHVGK